MFFYNFVFGVNIRVRIANARMIKCSASKATFISGNFKKKLYGKFIITTSSSGVSLYYQDKKKNYGSFILTSDKIKIAGKNYKGKFKVMNINKKVAIVLTLDMEEYVKGVIPGEMPLDWPKEALKAQAVLARTYGYYSIFKKRTYYDVGSTSNYQVFVGNNKRNENVCKVVDGTSGIVATYHDYPIEVFYHSTCGGRTETSEDLWGTGFPYLQSVKCDFCGSSPYYLWTYTMPIEDLVEIVNKLGGNFDCITDISCPKKTKSERAKYFIFSDNESEISFNVTGKDLRMTIGPNKLKSLLITRIELDGFNIIFTGHGFGHGVGLCQYGAKRLAEMGYSYTNILNYYFRDIKLTKLKD